MRFNIRGENVEVTNAIRDYIIKKVEKLEKYFDGMIQAEVQVKLKVYDKDTKVEITIPLKSLVLRAEEQHENMYAAIDLIVDKLERQVRKYKTKVNRKPRQVKAVRKIEDTSVLVLEPEVDTFDEERFEVVRTKKFNLKPMDTEEAILQMNMLGHQFFVYTESESLETNIVYQRKDGKYAVIEIQ
ncbi:ribosome-associated translation inhibitor RaiA [Alkalihalobacillus sp. MEB130]|uniref:ribosome hibernation-promoting factor, HPF/YfiA family n=1 Tax=Alkalihalobacillus sp. MEB130 TaxID=2976704 RepID=UPI0028DDB5A3|nr:ribosome-associated translation inhibitor RaiA [Alkalihalobacillus sp. MEB130]MDT8859234.1 ribosome-associated translation inhibitor RaiA [Alkalihalobacillus sp. MEB130]